MAPRDYDDDRRYGSSNYDNSRRDYGGRNEDMRSVLERNANRTGREMNGDFDEEERDRRDREASRAHREDRDKSSRSRSYERDRDFSTSRGVGSNAAMDQDPWSDDYDRQRGSSYGSYGSQASPYRRPGQSGSYGSASYGPGSERYGSSSASSYGAGGQSYGSESGMTGQHRGKGPRNYKRSDDRIREDINDRFTDDEHLDASEITVEASDGEVTLSGTVPDRQAKRRAEDIAESVLGVNHVQNNLRVSASGQAMTTSSQTSYGQSSNVSGQTGYGSSQGSYGSQASGSYQSGSQPNTQPQPNAGYGSGNGSPSNSY